jgi:multiple RNA-binding domain-containing protein 1
LKRKHDGTSEGPPNKKLQEFLDVMAPSAKSNTWSNADHTTLVPMAEPEEEDDEYVDLPSLKKPSQPPQVEIPPPVSITADPMDVVEDGQDVDTQTDEQPTGPISDSDWLRSKTSRLLDLTDDVSTRLADATLSTVTSSVTASMPSAQPDDAPGVNLTDDRPAGSVEREQQDHEQGIETISNTGRLFVRNLPYSATEEDVRQHFAPFGELEEVRSPPIIFICLATPVFHDENLYRDILYVLAHR